MTWRWSNVPIPASGAYAHSRNPMYVGWSAAVVGAALARRDAWLLVGWVLASRVVHDEVLDEEVRLAARFGTEYATYRRRVPRYLTRIAHSARS